jgi:hypothetical protein
MQALLISVVLKVLVSEQVQAQLNKLKDWILGVIRDELKSWLPVIVKTTVTGMAQAAGQLVVNTTDRVTDVIPGDVDDEIIDPIVRNVLDRIGDMTGIRF